MKKLFYLISCIAILTSCTTTKSYELPTYPECIKTQINTLSKAPIQTPRVSVKKYTYLGKTAYAVNFINPDGPSLTIYDENCNIVCAMGATIAGIPFDTCVDWNKAVFIKTVWTDTR